MTLHWATKTISGPDKSDAEKNVVAVAADAIVAVYDRVVRFVHVEYAFLVAGLWIFTKILQAGTHLV